jgi:hypothetical protein
VFLSHIPTAGFHEIADQCKLEVSLAYNISAEKVRAENVSHDERARDRGIVAERYLLSLGPLSTVFTAPIRIIQGARRNEKDDESVKTRNLALSAFDFPFHISPTCIAALYHFNQQVRPVALDQATLSSYRDLLALTPTDELLAVLSLTYIQRIIRKRIQQEDWQEFESLFHTHMELGYLLGGYLNNVGSGMGMMLAGLRYLSTGVLFLHDPKAYLRQQKKCERAKILFNCEEEEALWGCNHLDIAGALSSALGHGLGFRMAFGMEGYAKTLDPSFRSVVDTISLEVRGTRALIGGVESLHSTGSLKTLVRSGELEQLVIEIESQASDILKEFNFSWITKTREELPDFVRAVLDSNDLGASQQDKFEV